jgi:hypothetical protein
MLTLAHVYAVFLAVLPTLAAAGAVTTVLNQAVQRGLASRFPRFAHVVNTVAVDYVAFVGAVLQMVKSLPSTPPRGFVQLRVLFAILAATGLATLSPGLLVACAALQAAETAAVPVLTTADALGRDLSKVLGWCDARGISPTTVQTARQALADKDYGTATVIVADIIAKARVAGDPIPEDVAVTVALAEGLLAAHAIEVGMRALSEPSDAGAP